MFKDRFFAPQNTKRTKTEPSTNSVNSNQNNPILPSSKIDAYAKLFSCVYNNFASPPGQMYNTCELEREDYRRFIQNLDPR